MRREESAYRGGIYIDNSHKDMQFNRQNRTPRGWLRPYLHSERVCVAKNQVPAESRACRLCIAGFYTDSPFSIVLVWRARARQEEALRYVNAHLCVEEEITPEGNVGFVLSATTPNSVN